MYLYIEANRGDEVSGSTAGIVFEWFVHNTAYELGKAFSALGLESGKVLMEKGGTLDIGRTIFDDSHGLPSYAMWSAYVTVSPLTALYDLYIKLSE